VLDPRGQDCGFLARVLGAEFEVRAAPSPEAAPEALSDDGLAVAFVVADHDPGAARALLAALARARPDASRAAVAPPSDPAIFGLSAAGAEHILLRPMLETALRLVARTARETFALRRAVATLEAGVAGAAARAVEGLVSPRL
jgi:hypothetical protein